MSNFDNLTSLLNEDTGPFSRQRAKGFRFLKFEPDLETKYAQNNFSEFASTRKFALVILSFSLLGWLFWDVWQASRENYPTSFAYIFSIRLIMIVTSLLLLKIIWSCENQKIATVGILFNLSISSLGTILILLLYGNSAEYPKVPILMDGITLMTIAFLFPLGLNFRIAVIAAFVHVLLNVIVVHLYLVTSQQDVIGALIPFQITSFSALLGLRYYQEYSSR